MLPGTGSDAAGAVTVIAWKDVNGEGKGMEQEDVVKGQGGWQGKESSRNAAPCGPRTAMDVAMMRETGREGD